MNLKTTLISSIVVFVYIVIGGIVFHYLESTEEEVTRLNLTTDLRDFLENNTCVNRTELLALLRAVVKASKSGVTMDIDNSTSSSNWDFYSSIFFATTIVTTIGYGNIAPKTAGGRAFAVAFAFVGIPLQLISLSGIGLIQSYILDRLFLNRVFKRNGAESSTPCRSVAYNVARVFANLLFCLAFFCFIPAAVFQAVEGWTYGESFYYACITIMTIGFGDFVAGVSSTSHLRGLYRLSIAAWIGLSLASCAGFITALQDAFTSAIEFDRKKTAKKTTNVVSKTALDESQSETEPRSEDTKPRTSVTETNDSSEDDQEVWEHHL